MSARPTTHPPTAPTLRSEIDCRDQSPNIMMSYSQSQLDAVSGLNTTSTSLSKSSTSSAGVNIKQQLSPKSSSNHATSAKLYKTESQSGMSAAGAAMMYGNGSMMASATTTFKNGQLTTLPQSTVQQQQQLLQQHAHINENDRPPHSYIALISMAILSKQERKILLNEIYDWVLQNFPYYQTRTDKSWRNSIRHNLSLNECFVKVGKAGNGRGYYWSIHNANMNDFKKGDFRRRQARLRAKHNDKSSTTSSSSSSSSSSTSSSSSRKEHNSHLVNNNSTTNSSKSVVNPLSSSSSSMMDMSVGQSSSLLLPANHDLVRFYLIIAIVIFSLIV